jgi:hypothetical protein
MNFFSHAWVAARIRTDPAFVLGAMLPDLATMLGARLELPADPTLAAGVRFHHATDAAFHASEGFQRWNRTGVEDLLALELPRGPARGAAHVGVELLLDAALARVPGCATAAYRAALAAPAADSIQWRDARLRGDFEDLRERLARPSRERTRSTEKLLAERIERILAPRRRLRLAASHRGSVARWLRATRPRIEAEGVAVAEATLDAIC